MNEFFDKIYLINLERRPDRLERAKEELAKHNVVYTIVTAVDGLKLEPSQVLVKSTYDDAHSIQAISLTLTEIFKDAVAKDYDRILILEDDVEFHNLHYFREAADNIPKNFDLFYLGAQHKQEPEIAGKHLVKIKESYLCHAIGFGKEAIKYLSWYLLDIPNEVAFTKIQKFRGNSFCVHPNVAFQRHEMSDVSGMVSNFDELLLKDKSLSKKMERLLP